MLCPFVSAQRQGRQGVVTRFFDLGDSAARAACFLVQPELNAEEFRAEGFEYVWAHPEEPQPDDFEDAGVFLLITRVGVDQDRAKYVCSVMSDFGLGMPIIVVMLQYDSEAPFMVPSLAASVELACVTEAAQREFLVAGADDVICLLDGERLMHHRLVSSMMRIEQQALKTQETIETELNAAKAAPIEASEEVRKRVQLVGRRFLWQMPGTALDGIPACDETLNGDVAVTDRVGESVGEYFLQEELGAGSFGKVYKAKHEVHGIVAIKKISKQSIRSTISLLALDREFILMLNTPRHDNVVHAFEVLHGPHNVYLVMDYAGRLNLHKYSVSVLRRMKVNTLPPTCIEHLCVQAATAVAHLHQHGVCHRDLKPANMIVCEEKDFTKPHLRLADFGLAVMLVSSSQNLSHAGGSLPFCAPEVMQLIRGSSGYNAFAADIWSLAVVFLEIAFGPASVCKYLGWEPTPPEDRAEQALQLEQLAGFMDSAPPIENVKVARSVVNMLKLDPSCRWTAYQVLSEEGLAHGDVAIGPAAASPVVNRLGSRAQVSMQSFMPQQMMVAISQAAQRRMAGCSPGALLSERLGGTAVMSVVVERLYEKVLEDPLLASLFATQKSLDHIPELRSQMGEMIIQHFALRSNEPGLQQLAEMQKIHYGLNITDTHFDTFLRHFEESFQGLGVPQQAVNDAVDKFACLRSDIMAGSLARARTYFKPQASTAAETRSELFVQLMTEFMTEDPQRQAIPDLEREFHARYYRKQWGLGTEEVPTTQDIYLTDMEFSLYRDCALRAVAECDLSFTDQERFACFTLENRARDVLRHQLLGIGHCISTRQWSITSKRLFRMLSADPRMQYMAENPNMPKCLAALGDALLKGTIDIDHLVVAHEDLGLTCRHYDVFLSMFKDAIGSLQHEKKNDVRSCVAALRTWVTRASVGRQAAAMLTQRHSDSIGYRSSTPNNEVVAEGIALMREVYRLATKDQRIDEFFEGTKIPQLLQSFGSLVGQVFNDTCTLEQIRALPSKHQKWEITDYHFDCFMESLRAALKGDKDRFSEEEYLKLGKLEIFRPWIVNSKSSLNSKEAQGCRLNTPLISGATSFCSGSTDGITNDVKIESIISLAFRIEERSGMLKDFPQVGMPCSRRGIQHFLKRALLGKRPDLALLRDTHQHLHLTEDNFLAVVKSFTEAMRQLNVSSDIQSKILDALSSMEDALTNRHKQRRQEAQLNLADPSARAKLWQDLGGRSGTMEILELFQAALTRNPVLHSFFGPKDGIRPAARVAQSNYFLTMIEPSAINFPEMHISGGRTLERIHKNLCVEAHHYAAFIRDLRGVLVERKIPQDSADLMVEILMVPRNVVIFTGSRVSSNSEPQELNTQVTDMDFKTSFMTSGVG